MASPKNHKPNLRADTTRVIFDVLEQGKSTREVFPKYQAAHSEKDRAWIQEMSFGVLRNLPLLQFWLNQLLNKPLKNKSKIIEHLMLLGIYQLAFTRVSTHAAVSETVNATASLKQPNLKGLVNAVLRNFTRQEIQQTEPESPQVKACLPKWLYKKLQTHYPDKLEYFAQQTHQKAPLWLRVNAQKVSRQEYQALLDEQDIKYDIPLTHPQAIVLKQNANVIALPGFNDGFFAVQDGAAQLAAQYLDAQPQQRLLDACCAPGGKTCHILESQPKLKTCVALDSDKDRLVRVQENLDRLGLKANLLCSDASDLDAWWDGQPFDRILLDAPCSATGVIRRHPDIMWLRKSTDIEQLVTVQSELLDKLWTTLKPGGILLYATCSILPEENSEQIKQFLERQKNASLLSIVPDETKDKPGRQILPGEDNMDGFYYARLLKSN